LHVPALANLKLSVFPASYRHQGGFKHLFEIIVPHNLLFEILSSLPPPFFQQAHYPGRKPFKFFIKECRP
jgi:hypothetical protein